MRPYLIAAALLLTACGSAEVESDPADPAAVEAGATETKEPGPTQYGSARGLDADLEADFAEFMRQPLLLSRTMPGDGLKIVLRRDLSRYQAMSSELKDAASENPEIVPVAAFRQAQLFTRMGCTIVQTPPPNRLAADQIELYEGILAEQAQAVLQRVPAALEKVPADDPLKAHADVLAAFPTAPRDVAGIKSYCAANEGYWHDAANELTVDETEPARCEKRDAVACFVWAELGSGGDEAMAKACELGALVACPEEEKPADGEGESKVFGPAGIGE